MKRRETEERLRKIGSDLSVWNQILRRSLGEKRRVILKKIREKECEAERIFGKIEGLDDRTMRILVMRFVQGKSEKEIAHELHCLRLIVRWRIRQAMRRLP